MFDYELTLMRALSSVRDEQVALAMAQDLPMRVCLDLAKQRRLAMIVDAIEQARPEPWCAGWWIDREREQLYLRQGVAPTLLIAGIDRARRVSARLLLEARLKGTKRLVTSDQDGNLVEDLEVESALLARLNNVTAQSRLTGPTYEEAFADLYELIGDRLRLETFDANSLAMFVGSLGPGGAERQCANTAVGLIADGDWKSTVVCDHLNGAAGFFRSYVESNGVDVVTVDPTPLELDTSIFRNVYQLMEQRYLALNMHNLFIQIIRYASALRKLRPAMVHTWMDYCNTLAGTAAALVGIPSLVLGCRSLAPNHFRIFQPYMRPAYRALMQRHQLSIVNNSLAGARDYAAWLGVSERRISVIHNGYEFPEPTTKAVRQHCRVRFGIPDKAQVVGSVLRFSEEKQPRLLIDMANDLHATDRSLHFIYFGDGVQLQEMRDYAAHLGLEKVVHLPGVTDPIWNGLAAMDLFVLASRVEGLPNVLIEAQASGLPVICSRVGGAVETIIEGVTGISIEEGTASVFAAAVRKLLNDSELRRRMAGRATKHARKEFGLKTMIQRTSDLYSRDKQTVAV